MSLEKDRSSIWGEMLASRCRADLAPAIPLPGLYALFLNSGVLGQISPGEDGLLYIGMTDSSLEARNHLWHRSSGFSTLRRSLGAILREDLDLVPIPRSPGSSADKFKFTPDGEQRLTKWMAAHLDYAFATFAGNRLSEEKRLILDRQPPLNLNKWKNPQGPSIEALRALCR